MVVDIIDMKFHFFVNQHETKLGKECCKHENYDIHADTR